MTAVGVGRTHTLTTLAQNRMDGDRYMQNYNMKMTYKKTWLQCGVQ